MGTIRISLNVTFLLIAVLYRSRSQLIESVSVLENSELGTVVYDLRKSLLRILAPGQLANVTAHAGQQDLFWPFALKDLRIIVAHALDREAICEEQKVFAFNPNNDNCPIYHCCQLLHVNVVVSPTSPTQVFFIRVAVQDVNDNAPIFPHLESPFAIIPEDSPVGKRILLPEAVDIDSQPFGVMDYRIARWIQGNVSHFQLNIKTDQVEEDEEDGDQAFGYMKIGRPYLNVVHSLDRETDELYEFILEAIDGGQEDGGIQFTGSVGVIIRVRDVNDNAPEFDEKTYRAVIQENTPPRKLLQFKLFDSDEGENGRVFLNIIDSTHKANNLFRVSLQNSFTSPEAMNKYSHPRHTSGLYIASLHLLEYLDAEHLPPRLKFYITATDNGQPALSSRAEVIIDIINVNDQAPIIVFLREGKRLASSRLTLPEVTTAPESIVVEVHVNDADSSLDQLSCRVTSEMETFRLTEVHAFSSGSDAAGSVHSKFRLSTASSAPPSASTFLLFPSYRQFTLRTKVNLDRETKAFYMVTIMCTDNDSSAPLTRNASLLVSISDINDETPRFEHAAYQGHVRENEANVTVTHLSPSPSLRVTDADVGRNALITFSLKRAQEEFEEGYPLNSSRRETFDVSHFRIDPRSGRLWTVTALDAEETTSEERKYVFYVVATDDGTPEKRSSSALVTVVVDDVNDNPPTFEQYHYNFEVEENAQEGTVIGKVSIRDADRTEANRRVRFELRGRPEDHFLVDIDRVTGQLSMRRPVDFERQPPISFTVVAENEAPLIISPAAARSTSITAYRTEASVIITVLNLNDNRPEFVPLSSHRKHITFAWEQLPLSSANQTSKEQRRFCEPIPYKVVDKDSDPNSPLFCCTLELEDTFDGMFKIFEEMPDVLCALKRPPQPQSYKLVLKARDGNGNDSLSSQIQLSVIVKSEPDYRKFIQKGSVVSSPQDLRTSTDVGDAKAQDVDKALRSRTGELGQGVTQSAPLGVEKFSDGDEKKLADVASPSSHVSSPSHQMKIISVLVSIASIFCILLLFIIAALKCGLLDSHYFATSKAPENETTVGQDEGLVPIPQKHEVMAMKPSRRPWNEEYRTLGESYPEGVFCIGRKISSEGVKKVTDTYDMSVPFSTSPITPTNSISTYPVNVVAGPRFISSYQTMPSSPELPYHSESVAKSLVMSTIRPPDHVKVGSSKRSPSKPTAYLTPDGRLIPIERTEFYGFSEAYHTIDPSNFSKITRKAKEISGSAEDSKVTFNLEMLPMAQPAESVTGGGGFTRLLNNEILEKKGSDDVCENQKKSIDDNHHDLIVYGKPVNHSSFV